MIDYVICVIPNILPIQISDALLAHTRDNLLELASDRRDRYIELGIKNDDINIIVKQKRTV